MQYICMNSVSVLICAHICTKVWDERPQEDGWSLAWCCSSLCLPGVCSICGRGVINVSLKVWWGKRDKRASADAAFTLQQDGQITDRSCTLQEQVPCLNMEIMMTPLPLPSCSLHLFQSPSEHQPDWSAVFFFTMCVSVELLCHCANLQTLFFLKSYTYNKMIFFCHKCENSCKRLII